jgi:hypothetical protein
MVRQTETGIAGSSSSGTCDQPSGVRGRNRTLRSLGRRDPGRPSRTAKLDKVTRNITIVRVMKSSPIAVPENLTGWWGGRDVRPRCSDCGKVAFVDEAAAERSAEKIRSRGVETTMSSYRGKCGNWHVGHSWKKR